jgi:predicted short-subunit dehydrogenase-like oxidoreductase (DUF2520 family)
MMRACERALLRLDFLRREELVALGMNSNIKDEVSIADQHCRAHAASSAILPGMAAKPRIAIVGAGKVGWTLAASLHRAGYSIDAIVARPGSSSLRRAARPARDIGSRAVTSRACIDAEVIWFCVPDSEITNAARALAAANSRPTFAFHSSGVLTSDELHPLRKQGTRVASVHPLMTFVAGSRPSLAGVPFAIEGEATAVGMAKRIVKNLRGNPFMVQKKDKAAYHAWGTFASPLLIALLAITERVAAQAGLKANSARRKMIPILSQSVVNYASLGAAAAFSGPLVRGDVATIRKHLRELRRIPAARDAYLALARAALVTLPAKNRKSMAKILKG